MNPSPLPVPSLSAVREKRGRGGAIIPRTFSPWDTWAPPRPPEAGMARWAGDALSYTCA